MVLVLYSHWYVIAIYLHLAFPSLKLPIRLDQ